jgi:hypothetical protein
MLAGEKRSGPRITEDRAANAHIDGHSLYPAAVKTRWHELLDGIKASNMSHCDSTVYREILDAANYCDNPWGKDGELPARFTPTQETIRKKTRISLSQIGYSIVHLAQHGWLIVTKDGRASRYVLRLGTNCDCTGRRHHRGKHVSDVADVSDTSSSAAISSASSLTSSVAPIAPGNVSDVADVSHSRGMDPAESLGDTGNHWIPATDAGEYVQPIHATPQVATAFQLRGSERKAVENVCVSEKRETHTTEAGHKTVTVKSAEVEHNMHAHVTRPCERHNTSWGPRKHCLACFAPDCPACAMAVAL